MNTKPLCPCVEDKEQSRGCFEGILRRKEVVLYREKMGWMGCDRVDLGEAMA